MQEKGQLTENVHELDHDFHIILPAVDGLTEM